MGQDHSVRKLPGPRQFVIGGAALVDRVEDGLVPGGDRFLAAMVLPADIDKVGVGGEGFTERPAVTLVLGPFEATYQFFCDAACSLGQICSSTSEISLGSKCRSLS